MAEARTEAQTRGPDALHDHAGLEILDPAECRRLLAASPVARIAFVDHGDPAFLLSRCGLDADGIAAAVAARFPAPASGSIVKPAA